MKNFEKLKNTFIWCIVTQISATFERLWTNHMHNIKKSKTPISRKANRKTNERTDWGRFNYGDPIMRLSSKHRSSRSQNFFKIGALKNFTKFPGNTCIRVSFLIKLQAPPASLFKKRLRKICLPVNFAKFFKTP